MGLALGLRCKERTPAPLMRAYICNTGQPEPCTKPGEYDCKQHLKLPDKIYVFGRLERLPLFCLVKKG